MEELLNLLRVQRHDFVNHLQVISGYIQLKKHDKVMEYLTDISMALQNEGQVNKLENPILIASLLTNRHEAGKWQVPLDINAISAVGLDDNEARGIADFINLLMQGILVEKQKKPLSAIPIDIIVSGDKKCTVDISTMVNDDWDRDTLTGQIGLAKTKLGEAYKGEVKIDYLEEGKLFSLVLTLEK
jgi:hypothetical protein